MTLKPLSLRTLVSVIGLSFAVITAVAVPAGYFTVGYLDRAHVLQFRAGLNARYIANTSTLTVRSGNISTSG
jgi:hypothetical protein